MKTSQDFTQEAGIIDIVDASTVYYCYPEPGTDSENNESWAICRAKLTGTAWTFKWAYGSQDKIFKASDRLTLNYTFLK